MRTLRYLLAWYFFLLCILTAFPGILFGLTIPKIDDPLRFKISIAMDVVIMVAALVFGRAWWVLWHEKFYARWWCIAASVTSLLAPVSFLIIYPLDPRPKVFWSSVGFLSFYSLPAAIGIGGILFGCTDAARSLPLDLQPHFGRVILDSVLLFHLTCIFVSGLVFCARELLKHRHIAPAYLVVIALLGYVSLSFYRSLRRTVHNRRAEMKEISAN